MTQLRPRAGIVVKKPGAGNTAYHTGHQQRLLCAAHATGVHVLKPRTITAGRLATIAPLIQLNARTYDMGLMGLKQASVQTEIARSL
jgi:hypothetical protein